MAAAPIVKFFQGPGGRRFAYAVQGSGPPLVCPAWWVSHVEKDWEEATFRAFFGGLAEHFTVVRYDRPGVGLSDRDAELQDLDAEVALVQALVDHLDLGRTRLLGVSCGAAVSIALAARVPERVERLALVGAYLNGKDVGSPEVQSAMLGLVRAHWGLGARTLLDVFYPTATPDVAERWMRRSKESASAERAARLLELTYQIDVTEMAKAVRCPTLVVHRRADRAVPIEAGRKVAAAIPDASFVSLEGNVHPPWEGGTEVFEHVLAFLRADAAPERSDDDAGCRLDEAAREVVVDGARARLTKLEWGLVEYMTRHRGRVVARDELLREVWGQPYGGSNVVDAAVRSVRKKLGPYAASIETATGHGYRFTGFRRG